MSVFRSVFLKIWKLQRWFRVVVIVSVWVILRFGLQASVLFAGEEVGLS